MKVLIIGLGSIAQKHITALRKINAEVEILALRSDSLAPSIDGVIDLYKWDHIPSDIDFILISNPTNSHLQTLQDALQFGKPIFLEKPPLMNLEGAEELIQQYKTKDVLTYTAFNFRFHPVIQWAKEHIDKDTVREVNVYCGSYLPQWRPNIDYRQIYSSKANLGGGVHLDLIHEIDYLIYLFGRPLKTTHQFRKVSDLEIDSIDSANYWMNYSNFTASVTLNYFRKTPKRYIEIVTSDDTFMLNLINVKVHDANGEVVFHSDENILSTYFKQLQYFIALTKGMAKPMNSLEEAVDTLKICLGYDEK